MNDNQLDEQILAAIRAGHGTREKLMRIDAPRHRTWSVVAERLNVLLKRSVFVSSKAGWRLANWSRGRKCPATTASRIATTRSTNAERPSWPVRITCRATETRTSSAVSTCRRERSSTDRSLNLRPRPADLG